MVRIDQNGEKSGFVGLVKPDPEKFEPVSTFQNTEGGEKLTGMEAAEALESSFEKAAEKLPFRASGHVFFQTVKLSEDKYRLYAIDSEWLEPQDRDVTLKIQLEGDFSIKDILSGEDISVINGETQFTVPAGSLRVLEAESMQV